MIRQSRRARRTRRFAVTSLGLAGALFAPRSARAQLDVSPPMPNVMVLLDTSGSMEKMTNGTDPEADAAARCVAYGSTHPGTNTLPNRWGIAMQALTGDLSPGYSCISMPRAHGTPFDTEYAIAGQKPYDIEYYLPYHRPVAYQTTGGVTTACMVGPGKLPGLPSASGGAGGNATDFFADSIVTKSYTTASSATTCNFTQLENGMFDSARDLVRFGLMTFDNDPDGNIGVSRSSSPQVSTGAPFTGQWSYFLNWQTAATAAAQGRPNACVTDQLFELGARNPAAPPWEGRMFGFPSDPNAAIGVVQAQNDRIQLAVNAIRPYGATPIAGMMEDARTYFWSDTTGPEQTDPYVRGKCRKEYLILITDGQPNMDLRPSCTPEGSNPLGHCPYRLPEDVSRELLVGSGGQQVKSYVVGFAVSGADGSTPANCSDLARDRAAFDATCASTDPATKTRYAACCSIDRIATAGGTQAYFVENPRDLNNALSSILADIVTKTTTRTTPAYSPMVTNYEGDKPAVNASLYLASFLPSVGQTWKGTVQRQRYTCTDALDATPKTIDPASGDDFEKNMNLGTGGDLATRQFIVVQPSAISTSVDAKRTIRPFASSVTDGAETTGGTVTGPVQASSVLSAITPEAMEITATTCANQLNNRYLTAAACKNLVLNFVMGEAATDPMPDGTFKPFVSRSTNAFGAIFHSTPTVVGPPNALIRDDTYTAFRAETVATGKRNVATRKTVLYTATNDGILHAFDVGVNGRQRNELWGFIPPASLPKLRSLYPAGAPIILDGAPIVRDVVWERRGADTDPSSNWHTMLVAGFGSGGRGYYALDVTDPERPAVSGTGGPKFRWQLTDMPKEPSSSAVRQIFGSHSATPAITSVFMNVSGTAREVGVAILPGGSDGGPVGTTSCDRASVTATPTYGNAEPPASSDYKRGDKVHCWAASGQPVVGRSLSVVRLDTGEIIKTFMREGDAPTALVNAGRIIDTRLDSPMTGVPVVYPTTVGAVAQKVFIGDADGTVWRFDLSDANPANWKGELFFDTVNAKVNSADTSWQTRQPIVVPPVLALDSVGQWVLEVATGDQETFTNTGTNFVYSITEKLTSETPAPKMRATPNWFMQFDSGERVTGPMAVYDSVLYFATYAPAAATEVCGGGTAKLWGRDFVIPRETSDLSRGGVPRFKPDPSATTIPEFFTPPGVDFAGKIIPGVSINITPTCTVLASSPDAYIPGAQHYAVSDMKAGTPSLLAQVGGQSSTGQPLRYEAPVPRPSTPTTVDSWATVVE
jgi:type IV pilus assembly protein PilY1